MNRPCPMVVILWLCFILHPFTVFGQSDSTVVKIITPYEYFDYLEKQCHLKCFYDSSWFESGNILTLPMRDNCSEFEIQEILNQLGFRVLLNKERLYVVKRKIIYTEFAHSFIDYLATGNANSTEEVFIEPKEKPPLSSLNVEYEVFKFGSPGRSNSSTYLLTGRVFDCESQEPIPWVAIQVKGTNIGILSDEDGYFRLRLPAGQQEVLFHFVGMEDTRRQVEIYSNGNLDVSMKKELNAIDEVVITDRYVNKVSSMTMGLDKIDSKQIDKMPLIMGEADVLRSVLSMPGVQTVSEVSTGFNVRGGGVDQNLVILDQTPVMNSTHFFGFFSSFNNDIIDNVSLQKSGIPAEMGGRVSSILDVQTRNGSNEKFSVAGGISPITARLLAEGPVFNNNLTFLVSGRATYSDWVLLRIPNESVRNSSASFYDFLAKVNWVIKAKQNLSLSYYKSYDYFKFDQISTSEYGNELLTLGFFSPVGKTFNYNLDVGYSNYGFMTIDETKYLSASSSKYNISQYVIKNKFESLSIRKWYHPVFGLDASYYDVSPGKFGPYGEESLIKAIELDREHGMEGAVYLQNKFEFTSWLTASLGLRYSGYASLGPKKIYEYQEGTPRNDYSRMDSATFGENQITKFYSVPEYRLMIKIQTSPFTSFKLSANQTAQYLGMLSNTTTATPTDIWKLCDTYFQPQIGQQYSMGVYHDYFYNTRQKLTLTLEGYYKHTDNVIDYKVGAQIFGKENIETEVIEGVNKSYGCELQVQKSMGRLNGWFSYTYSRSLNKFESPYLADQINKGYYFPANFDRPHALKTFINYDFFKRLRISANVNYSTGRPLTLPEGNYYLRNQANTDRGTQRLYYSERNEYRMPDYFRVDIAATIDGDLRKDKLIDGSVTFSVVNVTGRKNPYAIIFKESYSNLKAYSLSIYGVPIFTVTYNFRL